MMVSPLVGFSQLTYSLVSDASHIPFTTHCFELTPSASFKKGAVWYDNPIDITQDFTLDFYAYFGNRDANGSDGIALVFKTNNTAQIGSTGGAIAYNGITPSVAIELDDLQNNSAAFGLLGDIAADHIAVQRNGVINHNTGWANLGGPTQASATSANIEDGNWHSVRVEYKATIQQLFIYFDCNLRLNLATFPLPVYMGQNEAYFGFTASTGGATHFNLQRICLNHHSNAQIALQDSTICSGSSVDVDATVASGVSYSWWPSVGVSNPNIANPRLSPITTTNYEVSVTDACGNTEVHEVLLTVLPSPTMDAGPDTQICEGDVLNIDATSVNETSIIWQSFGDGAFSDPSIEDPVYTPGLNDLNTGTVILLGANSNGICGAASFLTLSINSNNLSPSAIIHH